MSHAQHTYATDKDNTCFVQSYAKINITLDVLGRRKDNYHELATVMQTVDLSDTICLSIIQDDSVRMICSQPNLSTDDNLAVRAAQAVRQRLGLTQGIAIELYKRIPVAAGLGGGSSNAAAILLALQQWWRLPLSSEDMQAIAASLGSDVPFFLRGGLALCTGRGEQVMPLPAQWPRAMRWLLLVKPAISISTATVFGNLSTDDYTDGTHSRSVCAALQAKRALHPDNLHNGLEHGVLEYYPEVAQAREMMLSAGVPIVRLSGSGPTLFAPFSELEHAVRVQQHMREQGYMVFLTHAVYPSGENVHYY